MLDFSKCEYSDRHGSYGGAAGDKDGILYNGEYWIIKYPKSSKFFSHNLGINYTLPPLSEYLGSHIYEILGYDVHKTILGVRNDKLVVACKDFCKTRGSLLEYRTIRNAANRELSNKLEEIASVCTSDGRTSLEEVMLHLEHNPILQKVAGVKERFWDSVVIDILIDNNDRNNGNWGVLYDETTGKYSLAPVYDNGNSFFSKMSDEKIKVALEQNDKNLILGSRTSYSFRGHAVVAKKLINLENEDLQSAILRVTPKVIEKLGEIEDFFNDVPCSYGDLPICSQERKQYYLQGIKVRVSDLLVPRYEELKVDKMNVF